MLKRQYPGEMASKVGKYWLWAYDLYQDLVEARTEQVMMVTDEHVMSPKNIVIVSKLKGEVKVDGTCAEKNLCVAAEATGNGASAGLH
jgi:hypothetical protein